MLDLIGFVNLKFMPVLVVCVQVEQAKGVLSAQLLLQLETDMLLNLMVRQLTASISDSHPGAQAARDAVYLLHAAPFRSLWRATSLHKMPRPAGYMGPHVALQLLPLPLQQLSLSLHQHKQQQQQHEEEAQQQQPVECCVLAPTAPLLTELLALLIRESSSQLQRHLKNKEQQQQPGVTPI
jgi:hypothetical protein